LDNFIRLERRINNNKKFSIYIVRLEVGTVTIDIDQRIDLAVLGSLSYRKLASFIVKIV
jgi:hypothetical protein